MTAQKVCSSCRFKLRLTSPPSPGGPEDGVDCFSPGIAERFPDQKEEYEKEGYVSVWRIEVAAPGEDCECWRPDAQHMEPWCPKCGDPLLILATHEYQIAYEDGRWHRDVGSVEYACNNCLVYLSREEIKDALAQTDEL